MSAQPPLVPQQINMILQAVTLSMLGLAENAYSSVRVAWQSTGQPAWKIDEDVCILRCVEEDSDYNRMRDREYTSGNPSTSVDLYTRVWRVFWVLYGPNSYDHARMIRSALYSDAVHQTLAGSQLYPVMDISAPLRVPELFEGQWWERVDFSALFNEFVTEEAVDVGTGTSIEVIVNNAASETAGVPLIDETIKP
jgi:hypothetical protein